AHSELSSKKLDASIVENNKSLIAVLKRLWRVRYHLNVLFRSMESRKSRKSITTGMERKAKFVAFISTDLQSIHSQDLIHRDLHNGNVLQNVLYNAYIADLGLSMS
ncbi:14072_t:CDS:2, partial [Ambispora leptoticha]